MKKIIAVVLCVACVLVPVLAGCSKKAQGPYTGQTLHVYNWGAYTGENTLQGFEELTGCTVIQDEFESNEQMYIKVANGDAYDILVPSDYMIERLKSEDLIQPLDKSKITCMDLLSDGVKGLDYDPDNAYCIPYFWGTVGIVYDKTKVDIADLEKDGFGIFLNQKYKGDIYLYDSERDMFMIALKYLGYSMNTNNKDEIDEAYQFLLDIVNTMEPEIVTDEIIDNMAQGRKALGIVYSGDGNYIQQENPDMGFYLPETGTNIWSDCMVIPKNAENVDLAHEYINYICSYEAAKDLSLTVGYPSPNKEVAEELSSEGGDFAEIPSYNPRTDNPNDEVFHYDAETRVILAELWSKVKIAASNAE